MDYKDAGHSRAPGERGSLLASAADTIVQLHKRFYGKGPTKAKAYLEGDLLVVLLRGGYTRVEQTLHETGHRDAVIQQRMAYQEAVQGEFTAAVESLLERKVIAFMSANNEDPELMAELFLLAPEGRDEVSEPLPDERPR